MRDMNKEVIVNPKAIESVCGSNVLFHGYSYQVKESYEEIKKALLNAMELGATEKRIKMVRNLFFEGMTLRNKLFDESSESQYAEVEHLKYVLLFALILSCILVCFFLQIFRPLHLYESNLF